MRFEDMIKEIDTFMKELEPTETKIFDVYEVHPMGKDEIHFTSKDEFMRLEPQVIMRDKDGNQWTFGSPDTWYVLRGK